MQDGFAIAGADHDIDDTHALLVAPGVKCRTGVGLINRCHARLAH